MVACCLKAAAGLGGYNFRIQAKADIVRGERKGRVADIGSIATAPAIWYIAIPVAGAVHRIMNGIFRFDGRQAATRRRFRSHYQSGLVEF